MWTIISPWEIKKFTNKKVAIETYCRQMCNPKYNKIHYDCENCPIKDNK